MDTTTEPCSKGRKVFNYDSDVDSEDPEPFINLSVMDHHQEYANPFDSLPNEVIQEICMMLPLRDKISLRLVNRRLYSICSDPHLWRNVFIDDAYHETNASFIKSALQICHPHVQSLSLKGKLPFSKYQQMIVTCNNIHTLNLYGSEITLNDLKRIFSGLPHLLCLSLTYIRTEIAHILKYFPIFSKLKKLVIVYILPDNPKRLFKRWLLNNCLPQKFIMISIEWNEPWSRNTQQPLPNITHSAYFAVYTKLHRPLNFDFYDIPVYSFEIGPNSSESVAVTANGKLMITMRDMITPMNDDVSQRYAVFKDEAVTPGLPVYTSQYGVNITVLEFSSVAVSLESFRMIVKETPNVLEVSLKRSIISDCLDAYMVPLSVHCLKLRGLDVSCFSTSSRDSGIKFDVENFWNLLSRMKYLEYLSVNCCSFSPLTPKSCNGKHSSRVLTDRELSVKESVIKHIKTLGHIKRITRLKGLTVTSSPHTTVTKALDYFISQHLLSIISNLESLLYLELNILYRETATVKLNIIEGLESILQKCHRLSVLYINCHSAKLKLPVDPALYANLTHLWFDCSYEQKMTLAFGNALAISSKKHQLKYLFLDYVEREDVRDKIEEGNYIQFNKTPDHPDELMILEIMDEMDEIKLENMCCIFMRLQS
uniref:F-box domain-containing protein n=1 Tax=Amphimedon queenslandica TaxID=400682 RepID=A0A1X7V1C8_AMPQE